nr:UpxY family transcription antiterminator [Puia dinghuensis]
MGWYLIYTKPRHEKKVEAKLADMAIQSLLPLTKRLRVWSDRKKYIDDPLFPSYVFVHLNGLHEYFTVSNAEGVVCFVRTGKDIARVSEITINNIKLLTGNMQSLEVVDTNFQAGQRLVISQGPLAGLTGELVRFSNKQILVVRVELLKRSIIVSLAKENVSVCPSDRLEDIS